MYEPDEWLTTGDFAWALRTTRANIRRMCERGELSAERNQAGRWMIHASALPTTRPAAPEAGA